MTRGWQLLIAFVGLALVGVAAWQFVDEDTSPTWLLVAGALILLSPFFIDRLKDFSVGAEGVKLSLVTSIAEIAPKAAVTIENSDLANFAESYALVHEELGGDDFKDARIHLQDALIHRAKALAQRQRFDPTETRRLFLDGSPLQRVLTLGLFEGDPSLVDGACIVSAVTESRTANEQYHGLKLAKDNWHRLTDEQKRTIRRAAQDDQRIRQDTDRRDLADSLVALA